MCRYYDPICISLKYELGKLLEILRIHLGNQKINALKIDSFLGNRRIACVRMTFPQIRTVNTRQKN